MQNQRKESRKKLIAFTPVYELLHKRLIGYVGDLTLQGVMVVGETSFEVGRRLAIGIEFPADEADEKLQRVAVSGRVAWCRPDEDTPQYLNIGFEFLELSAEGAEVIKGVLDRYQFRYVMDISELKNKS